MRSFVLGVSLLAAFSAPLLAQQVPQPANFRSFNGLPSSAPPLFGTAASWTLDETTTGGDLHWVSPTSVDPNAFAYESVVTIEKVEVTVTVIVPITVDITDDIPPEQLLAMSNFAGPAPIELLDFAVLVPEPPEPVAVAGTFSFGLNASGFGFFDFTDVILGTTTVPTPFGDVTAPITALRIVASIEMQPVDWLDLGLGLAGTAAQVPVLDGIGDLEAGAAVGLELSNALPFAPSFVIFGATNISLAFKQGTLVPSPDFIVSVPPVGAGGDWSIPAIWPVGVPAGFLVYFQAWVPDPGAAAGFSASNGLVGEAG